MPLIPAKCPNCGAALEVDSSKDAAICPYCNNAYIVEKAINVTNVNNHFENATIHVANGNADNLADLAFSEIEAGNIDQALENANKALQIDAKNSKAFLAKCIIAANMEDEPWMALAYAKKSVEYTKDKNLVQKQLRNVIGKLCLEKVPNCFAMEDRIDDVLNVCDVLGIQPYRVLHLKLPRGYDNAELDGYSFTDCSSFSRLIISRDSHTLEYIGHSFHIPPGKEEICIEIKNKFFFGPVAIHYDPKTGEIIK